MVWKEVVTHNYSILSETIQTGASKVVEVAQKAEATAKAVTIDAAAKVESAAKVAVNVATNPQEVVATGMHKVEAFGNKKLAEIDAVRLKTKALEDSNDDIDLPPGMDSGPICRYRMKVWLMFDNPTSSLQVGPLVHPYFRRCIDGWHYRLI
jgi:hypothetical protein